MTVTHPIEMKFADFPTHLQLKFYDLSEKILTRRRSTPLKTIYNAMTKNGILLYEEGEYAIVLEAHYDFSCLYMSLWFEFNNHEKRKRYQLMIS